MKRTYCWGDPFFHWIMIVGGRGNLRAGSIWRQVTRSRGPSLSQYAIIFWLWGVLASLSGSTSESPENKLARSWRNLGQWGSGSVHVCALPSSVWTVWTQEEQEHLGLSPRSGADAFDLSHAQSAWRCEGQCIHLCRQWHCREHLWHSQKRWLGISWRLTFVQPWWLEVWSAWPKVLGVIIWAKTRICNVDVPS